MKKLRVLLFLIILLCAESAHSQQLLTFSKVIEVENMDKQSIYLSLRNWISTYYRDSKEVIQMDDRESGIIVGKAIFIFPVKRVAYLAYEGNIWYTIKLLTKDGRFKVEVSNFIHENDPGNAKNCRLGLITTDENYTEKGMQKAFHNKMWNEMQEMCKLKSNGIFTELQRVASTMKQQTDDSSDW